MIIKKASNQELLHNLFEKINFLIFPISYALLVVLISVYAPKLGFLWVNQEILSKPYFEINGFLGGFILTFVWAFLDAFVVLTAFLTLKEILLYLYNSVSPRQSI
jgi:hypothetical protein